MTGAISTAVNFSIHALFAAASEYDIPFIFRPRGAVPGVLKVNEHQGAWSALTLTAANVESRK